MKPLALFIFLMAQMYREVPATFHLYMQGRCTTYQGATTCYGGSIKVIDSISYCYMGYREAQAFASAVDSLNAGYWGWCDTTWQIKSDNYFFEY